MKSMFLYTLLIGVLAMAVLACQENPTEGKPSATGLEGRVLKGPMCPGPQTVQGCPDQPFSALFDVFDDQQKHATRFCWSPDHRRCITVW